jgi:enamine deaminase RidA (YjgF/YER057c/UK114 family)
MEIMAEEMSNTLELLLDLERLTKGEREELVELGVLTPTGELKVWLRPAADMRHEKIVAKRAIAAPAVLNEAYEYTKPSSFSRGLRVDFEGITALFISGTASVDESGKTIHVGDFGAQCWRTYRNITALLQAEGATWHEVVKATCYLRDIERDYDQFNRIRTSFFRWLGLDPLPASVGVQARLCREDLLVEIEAVALFQAGDGIV